MSNQGGGHYGRLKETGSRKVYKIQFIKNNQTTYVACWKLIGTTVHFIFVGTHESAGGKSYNKCKNK